MRSVNEYDLVDMRVEFDARLKVFEDRLSAIEKKLMSITVDHRRTKILGRKKV